MSVIFLTAVLVTVTALALLFVLAGFKRRLRLHRFFSRLSVRALDVDPLSEMDALPTTALSEPLIGLPAVQ